jgi:glucose-6-phosphate 1-dehydrogenase
VNSPGTALPPFDIVIFGSTGDLALRKLLPALFRRFLDGQVPGDSRIVGVARERLSLTAYRDLAEGAVRRAVPEADPQQLRHFLNRLSYHALDVTAEEGWDDFAADCLSTNQGGRVRVFYLSTSPGLYAELCERLRRYGLNGQASRVVLEKPIGRDLASAAAINTAVGAVFDEQRIFRIDHYLGKETVQNLLALRFGNSLFEPLWNADHIEHVHITVAENLGVEKRGAYYDATGALRDMVQNHLLQLLCMTAMEPPASLQPEAVREEKLKVLRALKPIHAGDAARLTVRGQYQAGASAAGPVPGYREDLGGTGSRTETFAAVRAELGNWRWAGVPFYLCTGKRLAERVSEIAVSFRSIPHSIFAEVSGAITPNRLVLRLQPDEGVKLHLMSKYPGSDGLHLKPVSLNMSFADTFGVRQLDAYERLLLDVVRGNPTLFMHRDEIEAAWRWIDPIVAAWEASAEEPQPYAAGSWGPAAAAAYLPNGGLSRGDYQIETPARAAG